MESGIMNPERQRTQEGMLFLVLFALTIPAANWLIGNVGTNCVPHGPCLVPVAPGLLAPSGVTMVGVALVLRDLVQRRLGTTVSALAILAGSGLSILYAPASLVVASATAFLLSELHAAGAPPLVDRCHCLKLRRADRRFDRIPLACFRLA
jgi:uncharacterized PurR-regulated membrane protein YhhQ (DUF165 family)